MVLMLDGPPDRFGRIDATSKAGAAGDTGAEGVWAEGAAPPNSSIETIIAIGRIWFFCSVRRSICYFHNSRQNRPASPACRARFQNPGDAGVMRSEPRLGVGIHCRIIPGSISHNHEAHMRRRTFAISLTILGSLASVGLIAQTPASSAFEAASVSQNRTGGDRAQLVGFGFDQSGVAFPRPGLITITNARLRRIIAVAYGINPGLERFTLVGGDQRILETNFDIKARSRDTATPGEVRSMLRTLLQERFALTTHIETRQMPVYAVTRARRGQVGPQLTASPYDCTSESEKPVGPNGRSICPASILEFSAANPTVTTMKYFSPIPFALTSIQRFVVDRPLVDATALTGSYEWSVTFSPAQTALDPRGIDVSTAMSTQLGLRLERRTGPIQVRVIDSVRMPTPD
jgi:uncharacterized protein (TIGR03435 family)